MGACSATPASVAEIDLCAFAHNIRVIRACLPPACQIMAVLKADAYGHGAIPLAMEAAAQGVSLLAVAQCQEGIVLRQAGITLPIVILGPLWPDEMAACLAHRLIPVLASVEDAARMHREAARRGLVYPVHINIDTGMGRLGFTPEVIPQLLEKMPTWSALRLEGLMTHLATADAPETLGVHRQLRTFEHLVRLFAAYGYTPRYLHVANSAALFRYPESHWTLVRPGIALYGIHPFAAPSAAALRPVLTWKTRLVRVQYLPTGRGISYGHTFVTSRPSLIGTLPVGYADGLCRRLSNSGHVLVHGCRAPLVGQICMDMCMVDLTAIPQARVGDEVVLLGRQGTEQITADEIAARCHTIAYEILCAIGPRVLRHYLKE